MAMGGNSKRPNDCDGEKTEKNGHLFITCCFRYAYLLNIISV